MMTVIIDGNSLKIEDVINVARKGERVSISEKQKNIIIENRKKLEDLIAKQNIIYGVNTGFGDLVNVKISNEKILELQKNLIRSHSSGVGEYFDKEIVRAAMLIRANTLAKGFSGIRYETVEKIIEFINRDIIPAVPSRGSVGASGDLAPLAHTVLSMMGEGKIFYRNMLMDSIHSIKDEKVEPLNLLEKEGVALINGTSFISAISSIVIHDSINLLKNAVIGFSLTLEALNGTDEAYNEHILNLRPHPGQLIIGKNIMNMVRGSEIIENSRKTKIQDAYSLRCTPQVLGPVYETIMFAKEIVEREINSVTDNPIIMDKSYSGGNFHGEYIAFIMDFMGIAISEMANISERRIARMIDSKLSGLPPFLTKEPGLNSGFMIPQYTAAALVSENKVLSHPSSVDSIPTSANQEDHVSMGMWSSIKALQILKNATYVISIEMLTAAQALEFRKHEMSPQNKIIYDKIREYVKPLENDRPLNPDIEKIFDMVRKGEFVRELELRNIISDFS
ncbi:MAG: histidine ammonia-lyase [Thermoplasmata archaeon]